MSTRLTEFSDRHEWDLSDFTLDVISLSYQVTLNFGLPKSTLNVIIEQAFTLQIDAFTERIVPEETLSTIPLLPLLHQTARSLTAWKDGRLQIRFEKGAVIEFIKEESPYESWHTFGNGEVAGIDMLCSPHEVSPWGEALQPSPTLL